MNPLKLNFKRMGVINITPNSFSDGGEVSSPELLLKRLESFGKIDALDIGAESTAPMNESITWEEEWSRLSAFIPLLKKIDTTISIDTYHPETIHRVAQLWINEKIDSPLIWNDISGKFDDTVRHFLNLRSDFFYVYCHNLAPSRVLSIKHMDYCLEKQGNEFLKSLTDYFKPHIHPNVIFDPAFGFSKTYEQNWYILEHFKNLQLDLPKSKWLIGISRKSFLRKKLRIKDLNSKTREELDQFQCEVLSSLELDEDVWIRTHRPELL